MDLIQWWNLVYLLPGAGGLLYLLAVMAGVVSTEHSLEGDTNLTPALESGHDVSYESDVSLEQGIEHHYDAGHSLEHHEANFAVRFLSFFGVGKVPLSILMTSWSFIWAFVGFSSNQIFGSFSMPPEIYMGPSLVITFVGAGFTTRYLAITLAKVLPTIESYSTPRHHMVGTKALAISPITERVGQATAVDSHGNYRIVDCRVLPDQPTVAKGEVMYLFDYDEDKEVFYVSDRNPLE